MGDDHHCMDDGTDCQAVISNGGQQNRFDELLAALADTRRRYVLHYLQDEERASMADVAEQVAVWKQERPPDEIDDEQIDELETALYHNHLPTLRDANVVEYDQRSEELVFRDPPELVEICLEHCAEQDIPN